MNDIKTVSYSEMAEEYFKSAEDLHNIIEKLKADTKLKRKNPEDYHSRISRLRSIYTDCITTGNLLTERAGRK